MFRFLVTFFSATAGVAVLVADSIVKQQLIQPGAGGAARDPDAEAFVACVTFYGMTYATGRLLYSFFGAEEEAHELQQWSRWHMVLLNVGGGSILLAAGWQAFKDAMIPRPSMVTGLLLLGLAAYDGWRKSYADPPPDTDV